MDTNIAILAAVVDCHWLAIANNVSSQSTWKLSAWLTKMSSLLLSAL